MDAREIYVKSISAARAFCEDRKLKELRKAKTDIFEWNEDRFYPIEESALFVPKSNQNSSDKKPVESESKTIPQ